MSTIVMVHGNWHASWCWDRLAPLLRKLGHTVLTPDLPGHGVETSGSERPLTMAAYARSLEPIFAAAPLPLVLVGHSFGGAVLFSMLNQPRPTWRLLIFLSGFAPRPGQSVQALLREGNDTPADRAVRLSDDRQTTLFDPEAAWECLYNQSPIEDARPAIARMIAEPAKPTFEPIVFDPGHLAPIPRAYVVCTADQGISPSLQRRMAKEHGFSPILERPWDHTPMWSAPAELAETLDVLISDRSRPNG